MRHILKIEYYSVNKYMSLDAIARKNLELTETLRDRSKKGSLLWVMDKTSTSMGGRLLRRWIEKPLNSVNEINYRLDSVEELKSSSMKRGEIMEKLKRVYDIERLTSKISYGTVNARDMIALKNSLTMLPDLKKSLESMQSNYLVKLNDELDVLEDVAKLIDNAIV